MPKVLYITYWGALEQPGQSLVVPAVKKLAQMGVDLTGFQTFALASGV